MKQLECFVCGANGEALQTKEAMDEHEMRHARAQAKGLREDCRSRRNPQTGREW